MRGYNSARSDEKGADAPREPLGNIAYDKLREGIRTAAFKPGQRLREANVADWLQMSRTPVREALRRLESEGLIAHEPRRGLIICQLDHQMVMELYTTRDALEGTAARLAARHASDAEVALLQQMVDDEAQIQNNPGRLQEHNQLFHREIFRCAHNRYLLRASNALRNAMMLLGSTTFVVPGRPRTALAEHRAIVKAVAKRDPDTAELLARKHIQNALQCRLRLLAEDRHSGGPEA